MCEYANTNTNSNLSHNKVTIYLRIPTPNRSNLLRSLSTIHIADPIVDPPIGKDLGIVERRENVHMTPMREVMH
jgi:hypothetical protein